MKTYIQITSGRGPIECIGIVGLVSEKILKENKDSLRIVDFEEHRDEQG